MMSDEEFSELTKTLRQLGLEDGDLGYRYWANVIEDLKIMRKAYLAHEPKPNITD